MGQIFDKYWVQREELKENKSKTKGVGTSKTKVREGETSNRVSIERFSVYTS